MGIFMLRKLIILFALTLTACATTETTGFVDPAYRDGNFKVKKVVIEIYDASLEETLSAEKKLAEKFASYGVEPIKFTDIAPPTRKYTPKEKTKLIKKTGANSLFTLYSQKGSYKSDIPATYHAGTTNTYVNTFGNTAYITTQSTPGYITGGYSVTELMVSTICTLKDTKNGNTVWRAEGFTDGEASYVDMIINAGTDAIKDLNSKGLLPTGKP